MADDNTGEKVIWFLAGVTVGAGIGLLFAPKSGRETRQYLGEKTAGGREFLTETGRDLYTKGRKLYERGRALAEDLGREGEAATEKSA